jgi:hypothetical protein
LSGILAVQGPKRPKEQTKQASKASKQANKQTNGLGCRMQQVTEPGHSALPFRICVFNLHKPQLELLFRQKVHCFKVYNN